MLISGFVLTLSEEEAVLSRWVCHWQLSDVSAVGGIPDSAERTRTLCLGPWIWVHEVLWLLYSWAAAGSQHRGSSTSVAIAILQKLCHT